MDQQKTLFHGELQLMRWSESSTLGATVTFWVHPEDLDSFKLLKARSGKQAGQRLACVLVEINDDESAATPPAPPPQERPRPREYKPHIGSLGLIAVRWCKDKDFQRWAADVNGDANVLSEADAKAFILIECGLAEKYGKEASRKHLDTDPEAGELFHERIRKPFRQWLDEQGITK